MRIHPTNVGSSQLGTSQLNTPQGGSKAEMRPVGEQVQQSLFTRPRPTPTDIAAHPELAALIATLNKFRRKLAVMVGDKEGDYSIVLTDDAIAAIDPEGTIYMGVAFLRGYAHSLDTLVGALAHEIGHRPQRVAALKASLPRDLSARELQALCLHEEIRADTFAGKALAELGMSWEPLAEFLAFVQVRPHPEYLPAAQRAQVLRDAHQGRSFRAENRRKLFPEFNRHTAPEGHLGDF